MNPLEKSLTAKIPLASRDDILRSAAQETIVWTPSIDRKTVAIAVSALGVGIVVGGASVFIYRRWTNKLNQQVEILSKSVEDVFCELQSLQKGMVQVQNTLIKQPRKMQFYESDSEESVYFSAAEENSKKHQKNEKNEKNEKRKKPILRRHLQNGGQNAHFYPENGFNRFVQPNGFSPMDEKRAFPDTPTILLTPSDEESDVYEDALQGEHFDDDLNSGLTFEKEFERGDRDGEVSSPFEAMDRMLDSAVTNEQVTKALEFVKNEKENSSENEEHLWRLAKATFVFANQCIKQDPSTRTVLLKEAKAYADRARRLNHSHADILKWSALTTGGLARYADTTQKMNYGLLTREFLQSALELRPNDPSLHHILGRWNYEISQLGWIERTAVRAIFGRYSNVNVEDAKKSFLEAERLKPRMFKSNMYYIGKCYAKQGQKSEARKWLEDALEVKRLCVEDELCDTDIQELLARL